MAQIWTECHTGTRCQGGRHWECCLRDEDNGRDERDKTSYSRASSGLRRFYGHLTMMKQSHGGGLTRSYAVNNISKLLHVTFDNE